MLVWYFSINSLNATFRLFFSTKRVVRNRIQKRTRGLRAYSLDFRQCILGPPLYFERATQFDPSYALAWAYLSRARNWQANEGLIPMVEGRRLSREAVERALSLNPNLAEAHAQMGRIKQQIDFDWSGADASYQRAVQLEPGNPEVVRSAAFSGAMLGRFDEALQLARRAVDLDPLNADSWEELGEIEFLAGQLDEATLQPCPHLYRCSPERSSTPASRHQRLPDSLGVIVPSLLVAAKSNVPGSPGQQRWRPGLAKQECLAGDNRNRETRGDSGPSL